MQSLIDTRKEVERWADRAVEFHFATVLSPWVRRALIAGGFGTGVPSSRVPSEIAAVVPYRGGQVAPSADPQHHDEEAPAPHKSEEYEITQNAPIELDATPFFHLDIVSAVRSAEGTLLREDMSSARSSVSKSPADISES